VSTVIRTRLLDLYRIGPGPSSSHTVGPMRAARLFREACLARGLTPARVRVELKGSLSATGRGHGTDRAVLAGLLGWHPDTCDVDALLDIGSHLASGGWTQPSPDDIVFLPYRAYRGEELPHPNTMVYHALDVRGATVFEQTWCSIGGGFLNQADGPGGDDLATPELPPPVHPYGSGDELVEAAKRAGLSIGALVLENEAAWDGGPERVAAGLDRVWESMTACVRRGLAQTGRLPGGLGVRRRAGDLKARVDRGAFADGYEYIARAQAYAFAVNEENAAGGRVVTAPTNGAAGIVPGVLLEVAERRRLDRTQIHRALATAGAFGILIKTHASLSGAEVGCQGEVGSATAMAAAALCEIQGGTPDDVECAAEIGMEHNLGLTCDPLKGLVQAPCIERNAMGAAKAWSAAQLALHAGGEHLVSFDRVIQVMKRTGDDMRREYKETGEGGLALAVNLPEC